MNRWKKEYARSQIKSIEAATGLKWHGRLQSYLRYEQLLWDEIRDACFTARTAHKDRLSDDDTGTAAYPAQPPAR
jgi:hypothetical protein